jgi:hypothetical protein
MDNLLQCIANLSSEEALAQISVVVERLMADLDDDARSRFLMNLVNRQDGDKVSGMVHL